MNQAENVELEEAKETIYLKKKYVIDLYTFRSKCIAWKEVNVMTCCLGGLINVSVGPVAQSVYRLTTCWTVRDRFPAGTRFSARSDRALGPPSLL